MMISNQNNKLNKIPKIKTKGTVIIGILALLIISYFIKIPIESGETYIVTDTLLGILIFHNIFILIIYSLIAIVLIFKSLK